MVQRFFRGHSTKASDSEWVVNNYGRRLLVGSSVIRAGLKRHVLQVEGSMFLEKSTSPPNSSAPPPSTPPPSPPGFQVVDPKVVIIMVVLLFALICAAFINSLLRFLLRRRARERHARAMLMHREGDNSSEQGLDSKTLATLPVLTFKVGEVVGEISKPMDVNCTICLSEFTEDDILRLLPRCNHVFHLDCIDMWLLSHTSCPVCRDPIKADGDDATSAPTLDQAAESGGTIFLTRDHQGNASARISTLGADILSIGKPGETLDVRAELVRDTSWNSLSDSRYTSSRRLLREGSMDRLGSSRNSFHAPIAVLQADKSARWQASSSSVPSAPSSSAKPSSAQLPSTEGGLAAKDEHRAGDKLIEMNGSALHLPGSLA